MQPHDKPPQSKPPPQPSTSRIFGSNKVESTPLPSQYFSYTIKHQIQLEDSSSVSFHETYYSLKSTPTSQSTKPFDIFDKKTIKNNHKVIICIGDIGAETNHQFDHFFNSQDISPILHSFVILTFNFDSFSAASLEKSTFWDLYVKNLVSFCRYHLGMKHGVGFGVGFGSLLILLAATSFPHLFLGLIFISVPSIYGPSNSWKLRHGWGSWSLLQLSKYFPPPSSHSSSTLSPFPFLYDQILADWVSPINLTNYELLHHYRKILYPRQKLVDEICLIYNNFPFIDKTKIQKLSFIKSIFFVGRGSQNLTSTRHLYSFFPSQNKSLIQLEGSGHMCQIESPNSLATPLNLFFQGLFL